MRNSTELSWERNENPYIELPAWGKEIPAWGKPIWGKPAWGKPDMPWPVWESDIVREIITSFQK